ncbi:ATPase [Cupriavidus basilensis]|uniref:ATPase n=1 Tax=Cupriavidus basilensis TaxID=68895 RepID=UPI0020A674B0|nr:ATPase [Cupriavidus basilensis]MCP3018268.1 ATPase [Cupriavidus basilensis]
MILDIHGKKLVFGMHWRTLTGSGTPATLAANIAREVKAARVWHEDQALHMGYLDAADGQAKIKDKLYSAAATLVRIPDIVPNALFVFRLDPPGQLPVYLVCGIVKGRPRVGFDQVVRDEKTLGMLAADFPIKCDGDFKLVGNAPELLTLMPTDRRIAHVPYSLEALAAQTGPGALLKKPGAGSQRKRILLLATLALVGAAGWRYGKAEYDAYQLRMHPPPPQKTPAERYAEDLARRSALPVAPAASAMTAWTRWFADLVPLGVGGWSLSTISCSDLVSPTTSCALTYEIRPTARGVTNESFLAAMPDSFTGPTFQNGDTKVSVTTRVPLGEATTLGAILDKLPTSMTLRVAFGSQLQTLWPVTSKAELKDASIFGTVPTEGAASLAHPVKTASWEIGGPLRNASEFKQLGSNVVLRTIDLVVNLDTVPDIKQSKFMLTVKGDAFARD